MYSSSASTDADIIIIGAGISGMTAAFYILEHEPSLNILILEAKNRIGGRTLSFPLKIAEGNNICTFDFGGQFVSTSQLHLMELLNKLHLRLVKPPDTKGKTVWNLEKDKITTTSKKLYDFKNIDVQIELTKFFEKINKMCKNVSFCNPNSIPNSDELDTKTMEIFITENLNSSAAKNFIKHVIRISCGVEPSKITVLFYLAFSNATGGIENQFLTENGMAKVTWIQGGADQICHKLAIQIGRQFIKRSQPVIEIIRDSLKVTIETQDATYQCSHAVIAIPPKEILDIVFNPPLPTNRYQILRSFDEGHLIKFVVTYKTAFWRKKGYTGHIISCGKEGGHGPIQGCYDITIKNWPALTGYVASIDCLQPIETFKTEVLQQLAKYFGDEALNPTDYYEKCWLCEPYTYNCNTNSPGIGNMSKYPEIRRPLGRLFWAGTETATSWNGYMGGAVQAGYRAAIEVLYECRPQTLTSRDIEFIYSKRRQRTSLKNTLIAYGTDWRVLIPSIAAVVCVILYFKQRNH